MSTVVLTANASTWLAAIVRGDYAGITKRSCSAHRTETGAFQYGPCEDTPPPCWRATLQHAGDGQSGMSEIILSDNTPTQHFGVCHARIFNKEMKDSKKQQIKFLFL